MKQPASPVQFMTELGQVEVLGFEGAQAPL